MQVALRSALAHSRGPPCHANLRAVPAYGQPLPSRPPAPAGVPAAHQVWVPAGEYSAHGGQPRRPAAPPHAVRARSCCAVLRCGAHGGGALLPALITGTVPWCRLSWPDLAWPCSSIHKSTIAPTDTKAPCMLSQVQHDAGVHLADHRVEAGRLPLLPLLRWAGGWGSGECVWGVGGGWGAHGIIEFSGWVVDGCG